MLTSVTRMTPALTLDHAARLQRARLSLDGLSVGDALGQRFFGKETLMVSAIERRTIPEPPWTYTDDTEMALAIVEVLTSHGHLDQEALAASFARRYRANPMRGYGGGAHTLLGQLLRGARWQDAAPALFDGQGSFGNGGAMRAAPLGAYLADDIAAVVAQARASAEVTHAHPDGQAGAIAIALAAAFLWNHRDQPAPSLGEPLLRFVLAHTPPSATRDGIDRALSLHVSGGSPRQAAETLGTGYQVSSADTVPFCLFCIARHPGSFEDSFWDTVAGLGDRDTTCAIVGGVVALHGEARIPPGWLASREPLSYLDLHRPGLLRS
jgi:ADP-ribosylglycohydrolase